MEQTLNLYPGCIRVEHGKNEIRFFTATWQQAAALNHKAKILAELAQRFDKARSIILNLENRRSISIPSQLATMGDSSATAPNSFNNDLIEQIADFRNREEECDAQLTLLAHSDRNRACWIIDQQDQSVLLANRVAVEANQKPPQNILASDISALWEPDSLRSLVDLVERDLTITTHTNTGYRWKREGDRWWRAKHQFIVDYTKIWYLGRPCRFEVVQAAIPQE